MAADEGFLSRRDVVPARQVAHFVRWVQRFLEHARQSGSLSPRAKAAAFLEDLRRREPVPDWQVAQAEAAVRIFQGAFRDAWKAGRGASRPSREGPVSRPAGREHRAGTAGLALRDHGFLRRPAATSSSLSRAVNHEPCTQRRRSPAHAGPAHPAATGGGGDALEESAAGMTKCRKSNPEPSGL